jgi:FimV-like protein
MGDPEGARSILEEVLKEGSPAHKQEAERLMSVLP